MDLSERRDEDRRVVDRMILYSSTSRDRDRDRDRDRVRQEGGEGAKGEVSACGHSIYKFRCSTERGHFLASPSAGASSILCPVICSCTIRAHSRLSSRVKPGFVP